MVADSQNHLQKLNWRGRIEFRATMLFLVVICLELSDILPAVDSESAVVSAVNDLVLAYTSTVVAMLGLRATFFIVDELVELFLPAQVRRRMVLACVPNIVQGYHIPPGIVVAVLFSSILGSMLAPVI